MLLPRFLTAFFGIPLLLLAIWWGQLPFFIMVFGICMLSLYEFFTLAEEADWPVSKKTGLVCGAILTFALFLFGTKSGWTAFKHAHAFFFPAVLSLLFLCVILTVLFSKNKQDAFINIAVTWLGIFYVVWALSHLFLIRDLRPDGRYYTLFLFLVIWALDVGAYGGGVKFGRYRLSQTISPKKTWEGSLVGTLCACLTAVLCQMVFLKSIQISHVLLIAFLVIVLAQLSDLSESLFKRNVEVKDSGNLLPGHGGVLDRFDSFLLVSPVYYYVLVLWVL